MGRDPLSFVVVGRAVPGGSKTTGQTKGGQRFVRDSGGRRVALWRETVAAAAGDAVGDREPLSGPLFLSLRFYLLRPKSHYRTGRNAEQVRTSAPAYPDKRPDATKLVRAVEDALTGIVWRDDGQIVQQSVSKFYGTPARVEVEVVPLAPFLGGR